MENLREEIIDTILEYAGDEFETKEDLINLAKEPIESLVRRLIDLIEYYHEQAN